MTTDTASLIELSGGHDGWRERVLRAFRFCLFAFVGLRVAMFVIGVVGVTLFPPLGAVGVPGWPAPAPNPGGRTRSRRGSGSTRCGSCGSRRAAIGSGTGAPRSSPSTRSPIRGLSFALGGHPFAAATIVSNAAFWGGLVVTYFLTASELSERAARTTVLLMCVFPTAHFFLMPYSESLFLLLSVTAFWGARRRRWAVAGAAGALAALTRSIGILIAPALVIEALHQRVERRGPAGPGSSRRPPRAAGCSPTSAPGGSGPASGSPR